MNILLVYAHPDSSSFNGAMKEIAITTLKDAGHHVVLSDLYDMDFKAVADRKDFLHDLNADGLSYQKEQLEALRRGTFSQDIKTEQEKINSADYIIFQFPLWWTDVPAILKGWFDRVFSNGFAYKTGSIYNHGLLKGKQAMLAFTTGAGPNVYGENNLKGDLYERLYNIHHEKLYYAGMDVIEPFIVWSPKNATAEDRSNMLSSYKERLLRLEEVPKLKFKTMEEYEAERVKFF